MRAACHVTGCGREARYSVASAHGTVSRAMCSRHAQRYAHEGRALLPIGTCGHPATVADMVARRPCEPCRQLIKEGDSPEKAAFWVGRMRDAQD